MSVTAGAVIEQAESNASQLARPFVEKIEAAHIKGVEVIMDLADTLIEARTALKPQGLYYRIFSDAKDPLTACSVSMSSSTADKITSIRERKALSDPSTWKGLPSNWTALYALCSLSVSEVRRGVERGEITPEMTVREARAYTAALYPTSDAKVSLKEKNPKVKYAPPEAVRQIETGEATVTEVGWAGKKIQAVAEEAVEPELRHESGDVRLASIEPFGKNMIAWVKRTRKERRPVDFVAFNQANRMLKKIQAAFDMIAPRWECTGCGHILDVGDEPDPKWECSSEQCGNTWVGNRQCDSCGRPFSRKVLEYACPECAEDAEDEMEQVGWETVKEKPEEPEPVKLEQQAAGSSESTA